MFRLSTNEELVCNSGITDCHQWHTLKFTREGNTLKVLVKESTDTEYTECGSHTINSPQTLIALADNFKDLPLYFNTNYQPENYFQGLNAKIRNLNLGGHFTDTSETPSPEDTPATLSSTATLLSGANQESLELLRDKTQDDLFTFQLTSQGNHAKWNVPSLSDGLYHHVAVVRNDSNNHAELFIDGESQGRKPLPLESLQFGQAGKVSIGQRRLL